MALTPKAPDDTPCGQDAAHSRAGLGHLVILWGVPGTGKSTFARWLVQEMGYEHVETDAAVLHGPGTALQRAWMVAGNARGVEAFIEAVEGNLIPVVVEYGMWATDDSLRRLDDLRQLGAEPWWFDGDRAAAMEAWRDENQKTGRPFADEAWGGVVAVIDANWAMVQGFFGPRIMRTIEAGGRHVPPAETYQAMLALRASATG